MIGRSLPSFAHLLDRCSVLAGAALTAAALAAPSIASAQDATLSLDRLRIGGSPDDGVAVWRPDMGDEKKARLYGQLDVGFSLDGFRIEQHIQDPTQARRMASVSGATEQTTTNLYADIGLQLFGRFDIQVMMPATLEQSGHPTYSLSVPDSQQTNVDAKVAAAGDLRVDARGILYRTRDRFFKLGAEAGINAPTGDYKSWAGDKSVSGEISVAGELDFKKVQLTLETGFNFRPNREVNDFHTGHEWTWGFGAFVPLKDDTIRLGAELFGSTGIVGCGDGCSEAFHDVNTPLEWLFEVRGLLTKRKQLYLGGNVGTRLTPGYAPDFRLGALIGGWFNVNDEPAKEPPRLPHRTDVTPERPDRDGDGVPDDEDACPNDPGPWDPDPKKRGCPVVKDSDGDGIPDAEDACPKEPGPKWQDRTDKDKTKNGCPEFIRRIAGSNEIQILKQIQFEFAKAVIKKESYPIMNEVYNLLVANPEITQLAIEGHTDNVGGDELNMQLSKQRAHACLDYLVQKGIDPKRLTSEGFGKTKPIDTNDTAEGRQNNRRVEFHITQQTGGTTVQEQGPNTSKGSGDQKPTPPPANPGGD